MSIVVSIDYAWVCSIAWGIIPRKAAPSKVPVA